MKKLIAVAAALGAVGCTPAYNRAALREELQESRLVIVDDPDVFQAGQARPQLPLPFRMAVVPPTVMNTCSYGVPEEMEGERREILACGDKLRAAGIISDLVLIPEMLIGRSVRNGEFYRDLRVAAARLQADAVLVLRSVSDVESYINPLGVLDITLVGMVVLPGHHKDALTIVEGVLLDNRNQYVYLALSAEGMGSTFGPLASIEARPAIRRSRVAALKCFGDKLVQEAGRASLDGLGSRYATPGK